MAGRFTEQVVFITGASAGIGRAMAKRFAAEGARVVLAARRRDKLQDVQQEIEQHGGEAVAVACDVTDRASLDKAVADAVEAYGRIDVAVANAGFGVSGLFNRVTPEDFRRQFDTNVFGVVDTTYAVLPHLVASKGRLVIIGSMLGRIGAPASSAYCASKFAVSGLAESLYYELAEQGVAVCLITPGIVESDIRKVDNQGVLHEGKGDPAPARLVMSAEKAAGLIADAVYKGRFETVLTGHARLFSFISRHFPRTFRFLALWKVRGKLEAIEKAKRE